MNGLEKTNETPEKSGIFFSRGVELVPSYIEMTGRNPSLDLDSEVVKVLNLLNGQPVLVKDRPFKPGEKPDYSDKDGVAEELRIDTSRIPGSDEVLEGILETEPHVTGVPSVRIGEQDGVNYRRNHMNVRIREGEPILENFEEYRRVWCRVLYSEDRGLEAVGVLPLLGYNRGKVIKNEDKYLAVIKSGDDYIRLDRFNKVVGQITFTPLVKYNMEVRFDTFNEDEDVYAWNTSIIGDFSDYTFYGNYKKKEKSKMSGEHPTGEIKDLFDGEEYWVYGHEDVPDNSIVAYRFRKEKERFNHADVIEVRPIKVWEIPTEVIGLWNEAMEYEKRLHQEFWGSLKEKLT